MCDDTEERLTIGLFDPCNSSSEPVTTFGNYHPEDDRDRIAWLIEHYNQWAENEDEIFLIASACLVVRSKNGHRESPRPA